MNITQDTLDFILKIEKENRVFWLTNQSAGWKYVSDNIVNFKDTYTNTNFKELILKKNKVLCLKQ